MKSQNAIWHVLTATIAISLISAAAPVISQQPPAEAVIDYRAFGVVGDGVHDDSAAFQKVIDANKGKLIVIPADMRVTAAGLRLDGPSYDQTRIVVRGSFRLLPDNGRTNFSGAWVGLLVRDCSNITVSGHFDGNRGSMSDREHIFLIALAGVRDIRFPKLDISEIRGDGLYISSRDYSSESPPTDTVTIGQLNATNSVDDGRNALSIISAKNVTIDEFRSERVGGIVEGHIQPGGFDIEVNYPWQEVTDVHVKNLYVLTAANSGLGIIGKESRPGSPEPWNVSRVTIDNFVLNRTGTIGTGVLLIRSMNLSLNGSVAFRGVHGAAVAGGSFRNARVRLQSVENGDLSSIQRRGPVSDSTIEYPTERCKVARQRQDTPGLALVGPCTSQR